MRSFANQTASRRYVVVGCALIAALVTGIVLGVGLTAPSAEGGSVLYVWFIDPAVSGADYAVSQILNEAFPAEVQELYERFNGSFAGGQSMVNLDLVVEF